MVHVTNFQELLTLSVATPMNVNVVAIVAGLDVSDRAGRLVGIIYGSLGQLNQIAWPIDGIVPMGPITAASYMHVYDAVAMDWNRLTEGVAVGSALTDLSDRWARQVGLFDLSRVLGAALSAANPVISGLYGVSGDRVPVLPHDLSIPISPAKITVQAFESIVGPPAAVAEGAAANLAVNTNHRGSGANSVEFDKAAGNILAGVSYTIAALDLSNYATHGQVDFFIYIPTPVGGPLVQVYAALGTDNANLFYWAIPAAALTLDAWNHVHLSMMDVSGVLGVGANLSAVTYCAIYVQTTNVGDTIANVLVDELTVKRAFEVMVGQELPLLYDGLIPQHLVRAGVFSHIYDSVAGDWNRQREGAAIGQALVDLADRAVRLVGVVYGSAAAQLLQVTLADALANPDNALAVAAFGMIWDVSGTDWNRWIESPTEGVPYVEELPAEAIADIQDVVAAAVATRLIVASTPCRAVTVRSLRANADPIRVGGATVLANRGAEISPGDSINLGVNNVNLVYVFGNGTDFVSVTYVN